MVKGITPLTGSCGVRWQVIHAKCDDVMVLLMAELGYWQNRAAVEADTPPKLIPEPEQIEVVSHPTCNRVLAGHLKSRANGVAKVMKSRPGIRTSPRLGCLAAQAHKAKLVV